METLIEMTQQKTRQKTRSDVKLNKDLFQTVERSLKLGMTMDDIYAVTGVNRATISTIKLVLQHLGKL